MLMEQGLPSDVHLISAASVKSAPDFSELQRDLNKGSTAGITGGIHNSGRDPYSGAISGLPTPKTA